MKRYYSFDFRGINKNPQFGREDKICKFGHHYGCRNSPISYCRPPLTIRSLGSKSWLFRLGAADTSLAGGYPPKKKGLELNFFAGGCFRFSTMIQ